MILNLGYVTSRKDCKFDMWANSIHNQLQGNFDNVRVIVCDFYAQAHEDWTASDATQRRIDFRKACQCPLLIHVPSKPSVFAGPHRLTSKDCWDAAGARNTILCYAKGDGCLAYCDDLSLPLPGWIDCVKEAYQKGYVACGCYQKVEKLEVDKGQLVSFSQIENGIDNRLKQVNQDVTPCGGHWLYGCSIAGDIKSFLRVNGWPEALTGSLGGEDCLMGLAMENTGAKFCYDRRMVTLESQEGHSSGKVFYKTDKGALGTKSDKSHAAERIARSSKWFKNDFGEGITDIALLRDRVLRGAGFPIPSQPERDWFDGSLIKDI